MLSELPFNTENKIQSPDLMRIHQEIAYFSYDDQHNFHLDESSLRYYYPPRLPVDLNKGFDTFEKLDDTGDEHLDALLETIIDLEKRTGAKCEADLITWRGMMTKVCFYISSFFILSL